MQVIATKVGFFGGSRRRVGDEFEVPEGTKASWFIPVGETAGAKRRAAAQAEKDKSKQPQTPVALSERGRSQPQSMTDVMSKQPPAEGAGGVKTPTEPPAGGDGTDIA